MKLELPGSKSYTNRALILASQASGKSKLIGYSNSEDSEVLLRALKKLGVKIKRGRKTIEIERGYFQIASSGVKINVKAAGTAMRFLTAFLVTLPGTFILDGTQRMRERPIGPLVQSLQELGASIEYLNKKGFPPLRIQGGKVLGGRVNISGKESSQFITALMLIAPCLPKGLIVEIEGKLVSSSYIDMTLDTLKDLDISFHKQGKNGFFIPPQAIKGKEIKIEADASAASYFWGLAALNKEKIRLPLSPTSQQGDVHFVELLKKMGCIIHKGANWVEVEGGDQLLSPGEVNMENMPDTAQTLAVVAAFAAGKTRITGLSTLRHKETDRLFALERELKKMSIPCNTGPDWIEIQGGEPKAAQIKTYEDHRMAMSFAMAAVKLPQMVIENPEVVSKSFPHFWKELKKLGVKVKTVTPFHSIFLHGFRATGKTSLAKLLGEKLNWKVIEMDEWIEKETGQRIDELTKEGQDWKRFREIEHKLLLQLSKEKNLVVSTGGGACVNDLYGERNRKLLQKSGILSIVLEAHLEDLKQWLKEAEEKQPHTKRPILDPEIAKKLNTQLSRNSLSQEEIKTLKIEALLKDALLQYKERKPLYERISSYRLNMSDLSPSEAVKKTLNWFYHGNQHTY